ncbi:MAG: DUF2807 domain-containing protein [Acidobacteria bacterium]|nr:DUF2807 domain-containing protein [Acidobacteriota bacterium]
MRRAVAFVLFASVLAACGLPAKFGGAADQVVGSGARKTERRDVPEFNRIVVEGAYRVEVTCGQSRALEIEADDNLLPLIRTDVEGGRLRIHSERGIQTQTLPHVRINVQDLNEVSTPGASDFRVDGLRNDAFKLNVEGASKFRAAGETARLDIMLNGAGLVDARELRARSASVVNNGAGTISVHASDTLDATVNGVGMIDYYGNPPTVNPKINGIGKINRK